MNTNRSIKQGLGVATIVLLGFTSTTFGAPAVAAQAPTGTIAVAKALSPASDEGRFDLRVADSVVVADAGDGDSGSINLPPGSYAVSEVATNIPLTDYRRAVLCTHNGTVVVDNPSDSTAQVTIRNGDLVSCTIRNTRLVATQTVVHPPVVTPAYPNPCGPPLPGCWYVRASASVSAADGQSISEGTVTFNDPSGGFRCTSAVQNGSAACSAMGWHYPLRMRAAYSGSSTFAPSSGEI